MDKIEFDEFSTDIYYKTIQTSGFLSWEYNPFYNYRWQGDTPLFKKDSQGRYILTDGSNYEISNLTEEEFKVKYPEYFKDDLDLDYITKGSGFKPIIVARKGDLLDLTTEELKFDINHPVDIEIQESYDKSVNLIINDDLNTPKLINSRFTVTEGRRFEIVDRKGDNDSNIYNSDKFHTDTSLYKISTHISNVTFNGVMDGGNLSVGNYVFYFRYSDSDGNETDFFAESGIVSVLLGSYKDPSTVRGGIHNTNAHKSISLSISNLDSDFVNLKVYYTKSSGDKTNHTSAFKILKDYPIRNGNSAILITGDEQTQEVSIDELNVQYNVVSAVKSQTQVQNRLFFGNISKPDIPYEKLEKYSLAFVPYPVQEETIGYVDYNYKGFNGYEYYDPYNIYYKLGYWPQEYYRFGIVYILNDYTLSPVFNVRGGVYADNFIYNNDNIYSPESYSKDINLTSDKILSDFSSTGITSVNSVGVVKTFSKSIIPKYESGNKEYVKPIGIKFAFKDSKDNEVKDFLTQNVKGFFFVRQKRIPEALCQGLIIGTCPESHIPCIKDESGDYFSESFLSEDRKLSQSFEEGKRVAANDVYKNAAIVPDAELNSELYSQLFSGIEYNVYLSSKNPDVTQDDRNFYYELGDSKIEDEAIKNTIAYIDGNIQLKAVDDNKFSTRAGEAETAYKAEYFYKEDLSKEATNLLRGCWNSIVGFGTGFTEDGLITIKYNSSASDISKIGIRSEDTSPFYAIGDRYTLDSILSEDGFKIPTQYRGDCYTNTFTHRMNYNFQDPEGPTNDTIIDINTWKENYGGYSDGALNIEKANLINRGDVNAVQLGHWVTFKCLSNINYAGRCEDGSNISETLLTGHPRTFYPLTKMLTSGEYKVPDSTMFNAGYGITTSNRYNFIVPDIPYIKNNFSNRICYSNLFSFDSFKNGYRVFEALNYRDYTVEYGYITKILEFKGVIVIIFEHGIGLVDINERVQTGSGDGGEVFLNAINVLPEKPKMISKNFGSFWKDSVIATENYIYGVDTDAKKIWRTNGASLELISDYKIQKFLNDNITLSEREVLPVTALRNVSTHYNAFKGDIMFTFYDDNITYDNTGNKSEYSEWNLCYNELLNLWTTRYSWIPLVSGNINNVFFSFGLDHSKNITGVAQTYKESSTSEGIVLEAPDSILDDTTYPGVEFGSSNQETVIVGKLTYKDSLDKIDLIKYKYSFELTSGKDSHKNNEYFSIEDNVLVFKYKKYSESNEINYGDVIPFKVKINITPLATIQVGGRIDSTGSMYRIETLYIRRSMLLGYDEYIQKGSNLYRHGQAGVFDNTTPIAPCKWYGEQHPFEFEFIVNDNMSLHKIFTNLDIISNKVFPEELEYEIIGDSFEFAANDGDLLDVRYTDIKQDSYDYQFNEYNAPDNFTGTVIRFLSEPSNTRSKNVKYDNSPRSTEFYKNPDLNNQITFRRVMKIKDVRDFRYGRLKGNTEYREDIFDIMLEPIRYNRVLYEGGREVFKIGSKIYVPEGYKYKVHEIRPKDKFIKFRVKYKGDKLAIITALQTFYTLSYS